MFVKTTKGVYIAVRLHANSLQPENGLLLTENKKGF